MLERTAVCIEPGSLRRLVPASKKPFKTQRMLHSTFWMHGAGEFDLPPLWTMLVGEYGTTRDDHHKETTKGSGTNHSNPGFLLDFLYPAGSSTLLRQLSGWPLVWQGSTQRNFSSTRFGHRLFSSGTAPITRNMNSSLASSVEDFGPEIENNSKFEEEEKQVKIIDLPKEALATLQLKNLMESPEPRIDYEEVWRQYELLPTGQELLVVSEVIQYLSSSTRPLDAERAVSLIDLVPPGERDSETWRCSAKCLLDKGMRAEAVALHKTALEYNVASVSPLLIATQLDHGYWESAYHTYAMHQSKIKVQTEDNSTDFLSDPVIRETSTYMPGFQDVVVRFATEIDTYFSKFKIESSSPFRKFAVLLASHALIPPSGTFKTKKFRPLIRVLRRWKANSPAMYNYLITSFMERQNTGLAVNIYNDFRKYQRSHLPRKVLKQMLQVFCDLHDVEGMHHVLDDWFFCYDGPDRYAYRRCLQEFAWQADSSAVEALFQQYIQKFCRDGPTFRFERPDEFAPLLNVYAKRGELKNVISRFESMSSEYGLSPSTACWNILINAYGKVQDIDGAFQRFQELLDSECKPDHWTIGTLMGMCVIRGDRDRTMELFQRAISMDIPPSASMMGCLVLAHIQDDQLKEAWEICEAAMRMELVYSSSTKSPFTRMWNQLLLAYAVRRDIKGTNRVIQRMGELEIDFDMYTYSALMESLASFGFANKAWVMLKEVMPKAGVAVTSFHYAIVMGGFLRTGELDMVFRTYDLMLSQNIKPDVNTSIQALKGNLKLDKQRLLSSGASPESNQIRFELAEEYFDRIIRNIDPLQVNPSLPRKGMGRDPVDVAYNTTVFRYMIYIYGSHRMMGRVKELYTEYLDALPETRKNQPPPLRMLEVLMFANVMDKNFIGVEQCWEMAFENTKKEATSLTANKDTDKHQILSYHRFSLAICLSSYMDALDQQKKYDELQQVVAQLLDTGFHLDAHNWNLYIQCLVRGGYIEEAFNICEAKLMINWLGWKILRKRDPNAKAHFSTELNVQRKMSKYLRPYHRTFRYLARGWLDANEAAAENPKARRLVQSLELKCPKLVAAIRTMERSTDSEELEIMTGDEL